MTKKKEFNWMALMWIAGFVALLLLGIYTVQKDNECMNQGHDGVSTMMLFPVGCYDNNNPLGVNDMRGYEYYPLP